MYANLPWIMYVSYLVHDVHTSLVNIVNVFFHTPELCRCNLRQVIYHHYCKLVVNSVSSVRYETRLAFMLFSDTFCPMSYYQFVFLCDYYVILSMFWTINFNFTSLHFTSIWTYSCTASESSFGNQAFSDGECAAEIHEKLIEKTSQNKTAELFLAVMIQLSSRNKKSL